MERDEMYLRELNGMIIFFKKNLHEWNVFKQEKEMKKKKK